MDNDLDSSLNYENYENEDETDQIRMASAADEEEQLLEDEHEQDASNSQGEGAENPEGGEEDPSMMEDNELEGIKARVREMEEEAEKLRQLQREVDQQMNGGVPTSPTGTGGPQLSVEEKMEIDARSVYVGNVDYGATAEELEQHFHGSGSINRVTILCNKFDGHPKGFAYVEFADKESVNASMAFDESLFRGRIIKVMPKRTNRPGLGTRPPRGRGAVRGFRGGRGSFFRGSRFPRRGAYRGRGTNYYSPY